MDARWLDDFLMVVDCGSFTVAAQRRGVSQSGLSRRIQALESWVGSPLFDRLAQPLLLTVAGRRFAPYASSLRAMLDAAQQLDPATLARDAGCVTIAASDGLEARLLPELLGRARQRCPETSLRVVGKDERCARAALLSGQALLWVVAQDPHAPVELAPELFEAKLVAHDRLMPVVAAVGGHALYELPGTQHTPVPLVDYVGGHPLSNFVGRCLPREPRLPHLRTACVAESMYALRALVTQGLGLGILFESMVRDELRAGELLCAWQRWITPVEVLMVRPRRIGDESPAQALAAAVWDRTPELPPSFRIPSIDGLERGVLLVSDVVA